MLKVKTINDEIVRPVNIKKIDNNTIKGYDIVPEIYSNIFICAKKKSGKTMMLFKIIKECIDKNCHLIGFVSTHEKDPTWIAIKEYLEKKEIPHTFFSSLVEGDVDNVEMLVDTLKKEVPESEIIKQQQEEEMKPKLINFDDDDEKIKMKVKKPKKLTPKYMVIFDDVSQELKNKSLSFLLKTNRHHKCKIIISSQYIHDLLPESRMQLDNFILFNGQNDEKLQEFYKYSDLPISFEAFLLMYKYATAEKYNFFYVDCLGKFRKNFNQELLIEDIK